MCNCPSSLRGYVEKEKEREREKVESLYILFFLFYQVTAARELVCFFFLFPVSFSLDYPMSRQSDGMSEVTRVPRFRWLRGRRDRERERERRREIRVHIHIERERQRVVFVACLHYEIRLGAASAHFVHADIPAGPGESWNADQLVRFIQSSAGATLRRHRGERVLFSFLRLA